MIEYFKNDWKQTEEDSHVIKCMKKSFTILDVGCGFNQYKKFCSKRQSFLGIDIVNENADEICDIIDFNNSVSYDLIICYGSINFYNKEWVDIRMKKVFSLLSKDGGSRVCMKVNPGHPHADGTMLDFFPWSMKYAQELSAKYNLSVENYREGSLGRFKFDFVRYNYLQQEDIHNFI